MATILLMCPCGKGPQWTPATAVSILQQSSKCHTVKIAASVGSWDNFDVLWSMALNAARKGDVDHAAMLHSDVEPQPGWLDVLFEEKEKHKADFMSAIIPQQSTTGMTSSGVADLSDVWEPHRRFTMHEVWGPNAPETFDAGMLGYTDKYLLHNDGCCLMDLRSPCWYKTEVREGRTHLMATFEWRRSIQEINGEFVARGESEDWSFSRMLHLVGAKSFMTRRVQLSHMGWFSYNNQCGWGTHRNDHDTQAKWGPVDDESGYPVAITEASHAT